MNLDNRRLNEIKLFKNAYHNLIKNSTDTKEILEFKKKIIYLENEEKEILKRFDVIP